MCVAHIFSKRKHPGGDPLAELPDDLNTEMSRAEPEGVEISGMGKDRDYIIHLYTPENGKACLSQPIALLLLDFPAHCIPRLFE